MNVDLSEENLSDVSVEREEGVNTCLSLLIRERQSGEEDLTETFNSQEERDDG